MKPDWDKLGKKYADNSNVMIVDVDCTAAGQGTCQKVGVKGYPTIKYYLPNEKKGKDYQGGRDFDSLASFVESKLNKATCDAVTKKGCAANEIAFLEKHATSTLDEIKEALKGKNDDLKQIRKDKSKAQAEAKQKEREFTKKEKLTQKSIGLLKQLEKAGGAPKKEEL
uniref:Thioredoxin domain-containing protein n=1 Tax=Prasinoderma coloniale TaxID=156133 RepID=A0A7R9TTZ8_9VIRI|mmetsp:Transcript_6552/g.26681  ORF Transcript_6552/g.26681 Transcript_6552/m.26681 type:complete len:168 (+) Transcript_6552:214-717(+)